MIAHNIFAEMLDRVRRANGALIAARVLPAGIDLSRVTMEPPRDAAHGDMATNAAMVLAKDAGRKPRELADALAEKLRADELGRPKSISPARAFINLTLKPAAWIATLRSAVQLGAQFGKRDIGAGAPINVEYVSANPTGPMHVGHCRGAVFGDALASLLAFTGYASPANTTSTTPAPRSTCWHARSIGDTANCSVGSIRFPRVFIRETI